MSSLDQNCAPSEPNTQKTPLDLAGSFQSLKDGYMQSPSPSLEQRLSLISQLKQVLLTHQQALMDALSADFGYRKEFDSLMADIMPTVRQINYTTKHLKRWMKPSHRHAGVLLSPSSIKVHYQPKGVVGIISPWNFPIMLAVSPLITALAAGNRVMLKVSEYTPNTNQVMQTILAPLSEHLIIIEGDGEIASEFSRLPFDHLLFTGSTTVGRLVAMEAAKNLTPVTLELGGKSPAIVTQNANMAQAVDAVLLGKTVNSGQICIAPDYVLIPTSMREHFIHLYKQRYQDLHADNTATHIINAKQYSRLQSYVDDAISKGASVENLSPDTVKDNEFSACVVSHVNDTMLLMKEEIFGPILPVVTYESLSDAIQFVNAGSRPLALYLFSDSQAEQHQILQQTHSGGVGINDTILHVAAEDAPFGGIGESGMGHYHGIEGFYTFSHQKTVMSTPTWLPRATWMQKYSQQGMKLIKRWFIL